MTKFRKFALGSASAALLFTSAAPAFAAPNYQGRLNASAYPQYEDASPNPGQNYRGRRHHHDRGIDAGDVIAGIGLLAGIAIIASAASNSNKRNRDRSDYPDDDRQESRYPAPQPRSSGANYDGSNDLGTAVSTCSRAAEQRAGDNARVEEIRSVTRSGEGWRVEGSLSGAQAASFSCGTNGGQVDFVQLNT